MLAGALGIGAIAACDPAAPSAKPAATPTALATVGVTAGASDPASEPAMTIGPQPTPVDTGSAGTPPCAPADLKASHGLVEDAGDVRLTEVVLVSATTCSVDEFPTLRLRDPSGAELAIAPALGPGAIDLVPGVAYTSQVTLADWCLAEPAYPLGLAIAIDEAELPVTGDSFPEEGNLPPCAGGGPPILEGSAWTPTP